MKLYHSIIHTIETCFGASAAKKYPYRPEHAWPETKNFELVMLREAACELGGDGKPAVNLTCVTDDAHLVPEDEILLYGPDIPDGKGSLPYARIALVLVKGMEVNEGERMDNADSEQIFRAIQNIDFVKYHIFPRGFMLRTSSESDREQVRISRDAVKEGISLEQIGNTFIRHYKQNPNVLAVKLIFVTAEDADYKALQNAAKTVRDITLTLSKILEGMPADCGSCGLKPICDEVEGMKELHFGKKSRT